MVFVTGGSRSGKSEFAEQLASRLGKTVLYIATGKITDKEMEQRIELHKNRRPKTWITLEAYSNLDYEVNKINPEYQCILLDCCTLMVSNLLFELGAFHDQCTESEEALAEKIIPEFQKIVGLQNKLKLPFIIVSSEVGLGIVPSNKMSRVYRDVLGRVNRYLAGEAEEAYFCVSGLTIQLK